MSKEPNETSLRGTGAKRLLKIVLWMVWVIDKVFTFIAWLIGLFLS